MADRGELGTWLVPRGGTLAQYDLRDRGRAAHAFAGLAPEVAQDAVASFAATWGTLGSIRTALVPAETPPGPVSSSILVEGEPLSGWQSSARHFALAYRIWQDVSTVNAEDSFGPSAVREARARLRSAVRRVRGGVTIHLDGWAEFTGLTGFQWIVGRGHGDDLVDRMRRADSALLAGFFVASIINERLAAVRPAVLPFREYAMRNIPSDLEAAMYLWLAQSMSSGIEGELPERPCAYCGESFVPTRRDKKHCSDRCRWDAARAKRRRPA